MVTYPSQNQAINQSINQSKSKLMNKNKTKWDSTIAATTKLNKQRKIVI